MNVEIGAEAALFPEKEYINGIAVAVHSHAPLHNFRNIRSCIGIGLGMRFFGSLKGAHIRFTGGGSGLCSFWFLLAKQTMIFAKARISPKFRRNFREQHTSKLN
jgi:hypothetical protein